jgi:hypothetical protein
LASVYLLLDVFGWFRGGGLDHMFRVGELLMLGKMDHIIHVALGAISLIGGVLGGRDVFFRREV